MTEPGSVAGGWAFASAAPAAKAHYFLGDVMADSLCGKWMVWKANFEAGPDAEPSKSDCAACTRKLVALKAAA